jgi:hypothetical protein
MLKYIFNLLQHCLYTKPLIFILLILVLNIGILISVYSKLHKMKIKTLIEDNDNILEFLHTYYVKNIYLCVFYVFVYFFNTMFIFIIIRYCNLGRVFVLDDTLNGRGNVLLLWIIIGILFNYIILRQILSLILYKQVYMLHLYLLNNDIYDYVMIRINLTYNFIHRQFSSFTNYLTFISDLTFDLQDHIKRMNSLSEFIEDKDAIKNRLRLNKIYRHREYVLKRRYIVIICQSIINRIRPLYRYIDEILQYFPIFVVMVIYLYDLSHVEIRYTYYGLLFYIIIQGISKIRKFWNQNDPVFDPILYKYFYSPNINYMECEPILKDNSLSSIEKIIKITDINPEAFTVDMPEVKKDLIRYLLNDFKNLSILDIIDTDKELKEIKTHVTKVLLTIGMAIIVWIIISPIRLNYELLVIMPLGIMISNLYIYEEDNLVYSKKRRFEYKENKVNQVSFWIMSIVQSCIIVILYIKHNLITYMNEVIWNYGIKITQVFTEEEKLDYMLRYIRRMVKDIKPIPEGYTENLTQMTLESKKRILDILTTIDYKKFIKDHEFITLEEIRQFVDNIPIIYLKLQKAYTHLEYDIYKSLDITVIDDYSFEIFSFITIVVCISSLIKAYPILVVSKQLFFHYGKISHQFLSDFIQGLFRHF